jgi:hypothetical protein
MLQHGKTEAHGNRDAVDHGVTYTVVQGSVQCMRCSGINNIILIEHTPPLQSSSPALSSWHVAIICHWPLVQVASTPRAAPDPKHLAVTCVVAA